MDQQVNYNLFSMNQIKKMDVYKNLPRHVGKSQVSREELIKLLNKYDSSIPPPVPLEDIPPPPVLLKEDTVIMPKTKNEMTFSPQEGKKVIITITIETK